jgi:hypothetical protein
MWIQRVVWEWMSKEVVYEDEVQDQDILLTRSVEEIKKLYAPAKITPNSIKDFLAEKIRQDENFAKRCLGILCEDQLMNKDLTQLFLESGIKS